MDLFDELGIISQHNHPCIFLLFFMLDFQPCSGALGAFVSGVDLCQPIDAHVLAELKAALLEYEVLFFRDQPMSPENHAEFAELFGQPQLHEAYDHVVDYPQLTILENDEARPSKIEMWHTDMTFRPCPPLGSILHGIVVPEKGGDTLFASMSAAYGGLSGKMQSFLSGLIAVHDFSYGFKESLEESGGAERRLGRVVLEAETERLTVMVREARAAFQSG